MVIEPNDTGQYKASSSLKAKAPQNIKAGDSWTKMSKTALDDHVTRLRHKSNKRLNIYFGPFGKASRHRTTAMKVKVRVKVRCVYL